MTDKEYMDQGEQYLIHTYNRFKIVLDKGEGVYLYDVNGKKYLDFAAGIAVFALGYGNKEYNDALKAQIDKLIHTSNLYYNVPAIEAAKKVVEASGLKKAFFTNSGAEAIEGALKMAKRYAYDRDKNSDHEVIAMNHSFHGRTMGALALTGNSHYQEPFGPMISGIKFAEFNNYINSPVAIYKDELYNLPFNMNTFSKMWNIKTPQEAKDMIAKQVAETGITEPKNLEEQGLSLVGKDVFEKLVKGYTEKQWGRACKDLPAFIIKRLPVRFTFDNNYFNDRYQGIPIGGYTKIIEKMLDGIEVKTDTDYFEFIKENPDIAEKTLFTGMIDEYFGYKLGALEYRSVRFETEVLDTDNYQGNAVVNYTEREVPYTRIIEHKHFEFGKQEKTVISREYSSEWKVGMEPYYPVNNEQNNKLFEEYKKLADQEKNVIFGGRLGNYKYYDMDKVIEAALETVEKELA